MMKNFELLSGISYAQSRYSIEYWTPRLFPETAQTLIPGLMNPLLDAVEPLCEQDKLGQSQVFGRGSWTTRAELFPKPPYAPSGYWMPREYFAPYAIKPNDNMPHVQEAIQHNVEGPDMDWMVRLQDEYKGGKELYERLRNWALDHTGQVDGQGRQYEIQAEPVQLSRWNGLTDDRIYTSVRFSRGNRPILRVDIGEIPKDEEFTHDGRLSGCMTFMDQLSLSLLRRWGKHWVAVPDMKSVQSFRSIPNGILMSSAAPQIRYVVGNRMINQQIWFAEQATGDTLETWLQRQSSPADGLWTWETRPSIYTHYFDRITPADIPALERRRASNIGDMMLGAGADMWTWLFMGERMGLFSHSKIGQRLTQQMMTEIVYRGYKALRVDVTHVHVADNRISCLGELSRMYKRWLASGGLYSEYFGPLYFLKILHEVEGTLGKDDTFNEFAHEVDPIVFLEERAVSLDKKYNDQGIGE